MDTRAALQQEWTTLQNNFERYESASLCIKLVAVALSYAGVAFGLEWWFVGLVVLVLWLQEGIFKTYQARLGERLLELEALMVQDAPLPGSAFQLHSRWLAARKGTVGLLAEYAASAGRPTVAFPYAVLLLAVVVVVLAQG
jgi:hypothetical protein